MLRESGIFEREEVRRWVKCAEMCALAENVQGEEVEPGLFVMRGRSSLLHWSSWSSWSSSCSTGRRSAHPIRRSPTMGPARPLRHVRGPRGQNLGWNICSPPRCPTISPSHLPCLGPRLNMDGAVRSCAPAATAISKLVKRRERLPQPFGTHRNVHTIPLCKLVSII